jgi:hypothetical protein
MVFRRGLFMRSERERERWTGRETNEGWSGNLRSKAGCWEREREIAREKRRWSFRLAGTAVADWLMAAARPGVEETRPRRTTEPHGALSRSRSRLSRNEQVGRGAEEGSGSPSRIASQSQVMTRSHGGMERLTALVREFGSLFLPDQFSSWSSWFFFSFLLFFFQ